MDSEHARRDVGTVAVPFGVCPEPCNVTAGGGDCPYRFRCAGCDHFRTDVSYLSDLQACLAASAEYLHPPRATMQRWHARS